MPSESSKEAPFFLMFGQDPILPLNTLLIPTIRYMGDSEGILSLETLKNLYEMVATNLKIARSKRDPNNQDLPTPLKTGDTVMIKNHTTGPFDPKYIGDYGVVTLKGQQVELMPTAERLISCLPDYNKFSCHNKLRLDPKYIPNLEWDSKVHKTMQPKTYNDINMIYMEIVTEIWCNKDSCVTVTPSITCPICLIHSYKSDSLIELSTNKSTLNGSLTLGLQPFFEYQV